jgi:hypothetical protein
MVAGPVWLRVESAPPSPPLVSTITAEATAPTRIDLAGDAVAVAIDRRAWCRAEAGGDGGVRLESKDALVKLEAPDTASLPRSGALALVAHAL